jgi:hypothetical protein
MNCWEYMRCGREAEGENSEELGVCPAATEETLDGIHGGLNGGRACWVVAGTYCGDKVQGTFAHKQENCIACEFHRKVREEEGRKGTFRFLTELLDLLP